MSNDKSQNKYINSAFFCFTIDKSIYNEKSFSFEENNFEYETTTTDKNIIILRVFYNIKFKLKFIYKNKYNFKINYKINEKDIIKIDRNFEVEKNKVRFFYNNNESLIIDKKYSDKFKFPSY